MDNLLDIFQAIGTLFSIIVASSAAYVALKKIKHDTNSTDAGTVKVYSDTVTDAGEQIRNFINQIKELTDQIQELKNEVYDLKNIVSDLKQIVIKWKAGLVILLDQFKENEITPRWTPDEEPALVNLLENKSLVKNKEIKE